MHPINHAQSFAEEGDCTLLAPVVGLKEITVEENSVLNGSGYLQNQFPPNALKTSIQSHCFIEIIMAWLGQDLVKAIHHFPSK